MFVRRIATVVALLAIAGCAQTPLSTATAIDGGFGASGKIGKVAGKSALAIFTGLDDYAAKKADNHARIKYTHSLLATVGSGPKADLFLSADSGIKNDSFRVHVTPNQPWRKGFERLGELQTNHTPALREFLGWVGDRTDAAETHAVIFTHGGGYGGVLLDYDGKPAVPASSMTLQNTARALAKGYTGRRLASLTLDACMMATIEAGEALKGVTAVMTGSEDFSMMGSTPYDELAGALASGKHADGEAFGRFATEAIIQRGKGGAYNSRTWSAIRLNQDYDRLVADVDKLAKALMDAMKTEPEAVRAAAKDTKMFALMAEYAPHYGDYYQRDLIDFCRALKRHVKAKAVLAGADTVEAATRRVLIAVANHPSETMAHGLAIYLPHGLAPATKAARLKAYGDCLFARHTRWDDFLAAL